MSAAASPIPLGITPSDRSGPGVPLVEVFADDPGSPEERAAFDAWLRDEQAQRETVASELNHSTGTP
jgi:hypothetical protein